MTSVRLKRLLARSGARSLIESYAQARGECYTLSDDRQTALMVVGPSGDEVIETEQSAVMLRDELLGYVVGAHQTAEVAEFVGTLAAVEDERRVLGSEALRRYRELSFLYDFTEKMSAELGLPSVASLVVDETRQRIAGDYFSVWLRRDDRAGPERMAAQRPEPVNPNLEQELVAMVTRVVESGVAEVVNQRDREGDTDGSSPAMAAFLCVPLRAQQRIIGALAVCSQDQREYGSEELKLCQTLALQAASAIERARYTEELRDHRDHLEELVTERTSQLAEAKEAAEQASRTKSAFLAAMSHEVRTPMNAVIGLTQLALRVELPVKVRDYLTKVNDNSHRLLGVLNDILDFSKCEAGRMDLELVPLDLGSLIETVTDLVTSETAGKQHEVSVSIDPDVPSALIGDSLRLGQVLTNLLSNAVKFTAEGEIAVTAVLVEKSPERATLELAVRDAGIGIDPSFQSQLFDSFTQADLSTTRRYGGSGLGLAISNHLVNLMGSEIEVKSELGAGSRFSFTIELERQQGEPVSHAPGPEAILAASDRARLRLDGANILVAEDVEINFQIVQEILTDVGVAVSWARDGGEAVRAVLEHPEIFDAVLMDVQMPEMDGHEATRVIRADPRCVELRIIAMTAHAMKGDQEKCLEAGMDDYISKPIDVAQLLSVLARWIRPHSPAAGSS